MSRIQVQIVRSTAKAHLISAEGKEGWIQARWLKADGTVAKATFEKAVTNAEERKEAFASKREFEAAERAFRQASHAVRVARETEKAVAAEVLLSIPGGFEETALVWFPKSAIEGGEGVAVIPGWMIRDREERAGENYRPSSYYDRHRMCKGEGVELVRGVQIEEVAQA